MNILILTAQGLPTPTVTLGNGDTVTTAGVRQMTNSSNVADAVLRGARFDLVVFKGITWADMGPNLVWLVQQAVPTGKSAVVTECRS